MNIIFNKETALQKKSEFEQKFKLATEELRLKRHSDLLHEIGWAIPVLTLSYFAILYGFAADRDKAVVLICVLLNLIVPVARVAKVVQEYCWLKEFIKSGRLKKDTTPPIVLYNNALETSDKVEIHLEFDPISSPERKCHVYLDIDDNKTKKEDNHIGDFDVLIDPTVQDTTVDLENETVIIPTDDVECNRSVEENDG